MANFIVLTTILLSVFATVLTLALYTPEGLKEISTVKCLDFTHLLFILGVVSAVMSYDEVAAWYNSYSANKADHNRAKSNLAVGQERRGTGLEATANPDKESRKALEASGNQVAQHADAYGAHLERIRQRATQFRDSQRIIQNQTTALERSEHRADAAERTVRTKDNIINVQSTFLEIRDSKIEDQRDLIALQAQQIKESHFDLQDMTQQIEEKDQQMWEAAGNLTGAEQEIIKLRAAVADKSTTSDYCAVLDAVHRRDRTIFVLEKQLVQQAKDSEFNQETVDSLADLLTSLGDKEPVVAVRDLEAWAMEREARFDDFVTHSGPVVIAAQQDACHSHRNTIELQHKLLINVLEIRDRQNKTIAEVKAQLATLTAKEEHNIKIYNQTTGEKQHLLSALNNSQNSLQAVKTELKRRISELADAQTQLAHHKLQQAIEGKKAKSASDENTAQKAKLDTLTKQLATMDKQLEASETTRVQEVAMMNNKVRMIREALKLTGLDCDLWTVESPNHLASLLKELPNDQETKLAESCADLSAANSTLQTSLTTQTNALTALQSELKTAKAAHHKEFKDWQSTLSNLNSELKTAKRDFRSRDLENQVVALQIRLKLANDDNKILADKNFHDEEKAEVLTMAVTDQAARLKGLRERFERCVKANTVLFEGVKGQEKRVEELSGRLEEVRGAWSGEREEVRRLTGLLESREQEVLALEHVKEALEKKILLGEEFVEVLEGDVPAAVAAAVENVDDEAEEGFVVQGEEVDCFADEFEEVDVDEGKNVNCFADDFEEVDVDEEENVDCFADEFEEVEVIDVVEADESIVCFADEFEAVEADEDGEEL